MKKFRNFIFIILSFFSLLSLAASSVSANDTWISVRSENFYLVGNAGEPEMRRVAFKLEQFRFVFTQLFRQMNFSSPIPTTVVVFKDEKSFSLFKPTNEDGSQRDWVAGYFLPGKDLNYIALPAKDEKGGKGGKGGKGEKENSFSTIFHEYVHFLVGKCSAVV
jgi:flagellar basal body rod protein FlgC